MKFCIYLSLILSVQTGFALDNREGGGGFSGSLQGQEILCGSFSGIDNYIERLVINVEANNIDKERGFNAPTALSLIEMYLVTLEQSGVAEITAGNEEIASSNIILASILRAELEGLNRLNAQDKLWVFVEIFENLKSHCES